MEPATTTYADVVDHFTRRSPRASERLRSWRADPDKAANVVPHVESAVTRTVYALSVSDIEKVANETEHALGDVKKAKAEQVGIVRDWHPPFAFQHTLHFAAESTGRLPTYQQFRCFCIENATASAMLLAPAVAIRETTVAAGHSRKDANAAIRWRVGNAYYAYLKEIYALAVLREAGIDARYHVLADALFRTDLWVGDLCISIYVGNSFFRGDGEGRKPPAESILGDGPIHFAHLEFAARAEFGNVHLPDRDDLVARVLSFAQEPVVELDGTVRRPRQSGQQRVELGGEGA